MKNFYLILLTVCFHTALGQTNAVWGLYGDDGLTFQNGKISTFKMSGLWSRSDAISTYQGKLDLYVNGNKLYNSANLQVDGWTGIAYDSIQSVCFLKIDINRIGILYIYIGQKDTFSKILLSEYDKRLNGGKGGIITGRHKLKIGSVPVNKALLAHNLVKRLYDNKFVIVLNNYDELNLLVYEYGKPIEYKDTLLIKEYYNEPIIPKGFENFYQTGKGTFQSLSHSGNTVILRSHYGLYKQNLYTTKFDTLVQDYSTITTVKIDKINLKFGQSRLVYKGSYNYKTDSILDIIGGWQEETSPNDSFYYNRNTRQYIKFGRVGLSGPPDTCIYQFNLNKLNTINSIPKYSGLGQQFNYCAFKLMPDGKLYFTDNTLVNKIRKSYIHCNEAPNIYGNGNFKRNIYPFTLQDGNILDNYNSPANRWYDYVKPKPSIDYGCDAKVTVKNNSDLSLKMDKFTWYFSRTKAGNFEDTITTFEPTIIYTKSGKYPYKVYGYSTAAVYGEWYEDTLFIDIPKKPITVFNAGDTIICRYLPLQFKNFSYSLGSKPGSIPLYVWTFGDGTTSNDKEPTHIYTKPGIYTVSLFYSNGYCDSTLVKNQYIRVVDAPMPGFIVANKQGCVPFLAEITDTVTLNVTKKEYLFTDSAKWKTISVPKFNYTFNKPGHYWAVQKLYGYTGCIIRTDSVQFFVSKGLLPTDSIAITLASFDTLNQLHLQWQSHSAAISYNVYRSADGSNFSLLTNTTQTNATDIGSFKKPNYYKVLALDSCGKLSSTKNTVKPQWISGERLPENEAAILTLNQDEGLGNTQTIELEWTYQDAINLTLGETNPTNPYRDENFANPGYLKKCYRAEAIHDGVKMYSNYECLNFEPQTFIPNSFTPNGDGLNDKFLPTMMGIVSYDMKIFSRWGQLVYSGTTPWNGTIEGKPAEGEVYMYTIQIMRNDRISESYRGMVHLLR